MIISIIVAMGRNRAIGFENKLPWGKLKADLARFKTLTLNRSIIMGRKTHESIGRVLYGRRNIILTRDKGYRSKGCFVFHSLEAAINDVFHVLGEKEVFIIGGGEVFQQALPYAHRLYITLIDGEFEGDTFFPEIDLEEWNCTEEKYYPPLTVTFGYTFYTYERETPNAEIGTKKIVDPRFAKQGEYRGVLETIELEGKCPFCQENFKYHKEPILKRSEDWFITKSSWPYDNAEYHFLIINNVHKESLFEITDDDLSCVIALAKWACKQFKILGGALALRFGSTDFTGATVCHLHFHLVAPKIGNTVNFPVG